MKTVIRILTMVLPFLGLIYNLRLNLMLGIYVWAGVYYATFLGIVLVILFFTKSATKKTEPGRWYDYILALASAIVCSYFAFNYESIIVSGGAVISTIDVIISVTAVALILEAVRRTTGLAMVFVCLFFIIHANFANYFPSLLYGPKISFARVFNTMVLTDSGMFGFILGIACTYIVAFTTFGGLLVALGAGDRFSNLALAIAGHVRGGAAKIAIIASALMGTMTGCPVANVGVTGSFSIPLMKKTGFKPAFAAATEAVASTGGIIMPPMMGAVVFVMVEMANIPLSRILVAALVPAILYYAALFFQIDLYAAKHNIVPVPSEELPDKRKAFIDSWILVVIILALILFLTVFKMNPLIAVYYSSGIMLLAFLFNRKERVTLEKIKIALEETTNNVVCITPLISAAGIIIASVSMTGITIRLAQRLLEVAGDSLLILTVLVAIISYFLGMGVSAILSYIILATLVVPSMVNFGVPPIAAHFFVVYMGLTTLITPPFAVAAAVAAPLAGANFYRTGWEAVKLGIISFMVPFTIVFAPVLLFEDVHLIPFIIRAAVSLLAIYILAVGLQGYFLNRSVSYWERVFWVIGGISLFIPLHVFDLAGVIFTTLAVVSFFTVSKAIKRKETELPSSKSGL